jgi:DnaJ-domain-containing protein 1
MSYMDARVERKESMRKGIARITIEPGIAYLRSEPFNQEFIDELKVSTMSRRWDTAARAWTLDPMEVPIAARIVEKYFRKLIIEPTEDKEGGSKERRGWRGARGARKVMDMSVGKGDAYSVLCITKDAPDGLVKSAYTKLAMVYHPDVNSDPRATERMTEINKAYEEIKQKRGIL